MLQHHHSPQPDEHKPWLFSRTGIVTVGALLILGFLIYRGHTAHLLGLLPYAFLLACPVMHLFMHHGHGSHRHRINPDGTRETRDSMNYTEEKNHESH